MRWAAASEMVLRLDVVVAAEKATFGLPNRASAGWRSTAASPSCRGASRMSAAIGMLLTGRRVPAAEALAFGLVNEVVPRSGLDKAVDRWIAGILRVCAALGEGHQADGAPGRRSLAAGSAEAPPAGPGRRPSVDRPGRRRKGLRREARAAVAGSMTYVVTSTCIDVKDGICQKVCPWSASIEGGRMMYIQPDECINCGICVSVCPVQAIYEDVDVPSDRTAVRRRQCRVLRRRGHRLGAPGGVTPSFVEHARHAFHPQPFPRKIC